MNENDLIPDYLQDVYNALMCAFPDGFREDEYWPLFAILHESMSFWTLADVLSVLGHKDRSEVYNDASGYGIDPPPPTEEIEKVRLKLKTVATTSRPTKEYLPPSTASDSDR